MSRLGMTMGSVTLLALAIVGPWWLIRIVSRNRAGGARTLAIAALVAVVTIPTVLDIRSALLWWSVDRPIEGAPAPGAGVPRTSADTSAGRRLEWSDWWSGESRVVEYEPSGGFRFTIGHRDGVVQGLAWLLRLAALVTCGVAVAKVVRGRTNWRGNIDAA